MLTRASKKTKLSPDRFQQFKFVSHSYCRQLNIYLLTFENSSDTIDLKTAIQKHKLQVDQYLSSKGMTLEEFLEQIKSERSKSPKKSVSPTKQSSPTRGTPKRGRGRPIQNKDDQSHQKTQMKIDDVEQWAEHFKKNAKNKKRQKRFLESGEQQLPPVNSHEQSKDTAMNSLSPTAKQSANTSDDIQMIDQSSSDKKQVKPLFTIEITETKQTQQKLNRDSSIQSIDKSDFNQQNIWSVNKKQNKFTPPKTRSQQEEAELQRMKNELERKKKEREAIKAKLALIERDLLDSDTESYYPTLNKVPGTILFNLPKKILGVNKDKETQTVYYLCNWIQDYRENFYTPSIVSSLELRAMDLGEMMYEYYRKNMKISVLRQECEKIDDEMQLLD